MSETPFTRLVDSLDTPMVIVTAALAGERAGCLVGFHSQCSIDPERYSVWLSKANHTYRVAQLASELAVHFLTQDDHDLAELFGTKSGDDIDKFQFCATERGPHGVPLLARCPNRLIARRTSLLDDGGDHVSFVTEVVDAACPAPFVPLRLSDVQDLQPGHEARERPRPPTERAG
jgi:flavin reductase (DIM6/NTAB) family NADH-FMN oxidoreductase RutF